MAEYNLGSAQGVIEVRYDGAGVAKAQQDISGLGKKAQGTAPSLDKVGRAGALAGTVVAGGFAVAVKSASDFETRMSAIGAVSGASGAELDALRQKAIQLGADTAFSAGESAQAIEELIKAGLSVEDVLNGAADATVNLAAAGSISMPEAATIASNAMNQFNLTADDMVGVVDNIAGAANASAIDVGEFGQSLQQVGAVANLSGASFKDTATAIALMGNAGIRGSDAGTSLKTMLQNLQPQTAKQKDLFRELGIVTADGANKFYDAQGNLKSLSDVAGILNQSLSGMTAQQKQATLEMMFGTDAIRAAAVISNAGADGFNKMSASMNKVSAADVAAKRMDNLGGSLEQLKGSLETLAISIGSAFLPYLQRMADMLTAAVNWFMQLDPAVQNGIVAFIGIVGAIGLALGAFVKIVSFMKQIKAAFLAVKAVAIPTWLAALGPVALVIAAIAAVVAIIVLLWKKSETFRNIVMAVWNAIKTAISAVVSWFTTTVPAAFSAVWNAITTGLTAVKNFFVTIWNGIVAVVTTVWNAIKAVIMAGVNIVRAVISAGIGFIGAIWNAFWNTFGGLIKATWDLIIAIIQLAWTIIKGLFVAAINGLKIIVTAGWNVIKAVTSAVWNAIKAVITAVWNAIRPVVMGAVNAIRSVITAAWNVIKSVTSSVWNAIKSVISTVMNAIKSVVTAVSGAVRGALTAAWNAVKGVTTAAWNAMKSTVTGAIDSIMGVIRGIKDRVLGALSGAASWLVDTGRKIIQGLIDGITGMIGKVTDTIKGITSKIADFLPGSPVKVGPLKVLNRGHAGKQIVEMIVGGLDDMRRPMADAVERVVTVPVLAGDLARLAAPVPPLPAPAVAFPAPASAAPSGRSPAGLQLVSGTLDISPRGKAFIRGQAQEVYETETRFAAAYGRMG